MSSPSGQANGGQLSSRQSRIVGALLGLHAGDCLGATVEFLPRVMIARSYPQGVRDIIGGGHFDWSPGHATDDTDMTRGVLLAYKTLHDARTEGTRDSNSTMTNGEGADLDVARLAGENFLRWVDGEWPDRTPGWLPKDMGGATARGLERYRVSRDPERAGAGQGSAGNGSLMRCLPTALFQPDRHKMIAESIRISKITHDDFRCTTACAVYNSIAAALIDGVSVENAVDHGEAVAIRLERRMDGPVMQAVRRGRQVDVADMAANGAPIDMEGECSGYVLETLTVAVAAVRDARSLEDVLVDVVRIGRDTDTNAAVAGGLLGARDGEDAIPTRWKEKLQFGKEFREVALAMATA
ncbi:ADP-ribosylglycohydrolase [Sodiomyces alkalinus F11]|uniref:ADP-ribosylhydrolase ARH3 n=1 Tax=Sodiomyces alkalinus (strain CBS 110278 / VKM F-3762 / F11) TaxID=1314773 RepID=A0A3N2PTB1_SODAK|nr:ADP-ribosylglycohydrolase [Sodiomyces alkalinus F11]ROT37755.1 ADP-ribosylglycohydrolase [Sodiomyces alkalinus F11]